MRILRIFEALHRPWLRFGMQIQSLIVVFPALFIFHRKSATASFFSPSLCDPDAHPTRKQGFLWINQQKKSLFTHKVQVAETKFYCFFIFFIVKYGIVGIIGIVAFGD